MSCKAMLGKKYGPARVLPILMAGFGSMTILMTAVKNFSGVMALRWFLGMPFENHEDVVVLIDYKECLRALSFRW